MTVTQLALCALHTCMKMCVCQIYWSWECSVIYKLCVIILLYFLKSLYKGGKGVCLWIANIPPLSNTDNSKNYLFC